uniref:Uncharacterized protein n=1 Tax=Burkholderia cenocepacia TaxID=95486 RepID=A0A071M599_9BURK
MAPLHDLHLPGIAMHDLLVFTDHPSFLIQDRHSHGDEAFAEVFEYHVLPDLGTRLTHRAFEIHTPHDLINARHIAKHDVVRVAAHRIVLIRGATMLTQFSDVSPRQISFIVCSALAAFRNRRFRCRHMDRCGWRVWVAIRA